MGVVPERERQAEEPGSAWYKRLYELFWLKASYCT